MINSTTKIGNKKVQEPKERYYRAVFRKRQHRCWNRCREDTCANLFKVMNEDTPKYQVEWVDENGKIYNSIFNFKKDASIEKKWPTYLKGESYAKQRSSTDMSF